MQRQKLTEDQKGNIISKAVWKWLQREKAIEFVPWVLDPKSDKYDPMKAAKQTERNELLSSIEQTILDVTRRIKDAEES